MIELRKEFYTATGQRIEYVAQYRLDGHKLIWSGKACFDDEWEHIPGGMFSEVALGFEELAVIGTIEGLIEARVTAAPR